MMDDSELEAMVTASASSSIGDAVSGRAQSLPDEDEDEDDELYYIPERRPSLDLGPSPMDTSHWHYVDQASTPALSYNSMTSEENLSNMDVVEGSSTRVQLDRADSYSSCYSFDSDDCEKKIPRVKSSDDAVSELSGTPELIQDPNAIRHPSLTVAFTFKAICETLGKLTEADFKTFKTMLWKRYPQSFNTPPQGMDMVDLVDRLLECYDLEVSLQITRALLEEMERKNIIAFLQTLCNRNEVRHELKETLKRIYGEVFEDSAMQGEKRPFHDVFTNLHITSTSNNGPNLEHEVLTIEKLNTNYTEGNQLSTGDILSAERLEELSVKLLLVTGAPGSGKSMAVRKLILDWVEERSHQHVSFLFPVPFRELKKFEDSKVSLVEIIQTLYPETKRLTEQDYRSDDCKLMFVFDGLDEYEEPLDFQNTTLVGDHEVATTLNILLVNLLRNRMLYRALFVFFSRPPLKRCIPSDTARDQIDVRGFHDSEREEYFRKRFKDPNQAAQVIAYINSSKTLRIMCHLPLFCSLVADEHQRIFKEQGAGAEVPRSITYMYTKLMLALTRQHHTFRALHCSPEKERDFLIKLGKLAFTMLEQGQFKIKKPKLQEHGVDNVEAVIKSGLCMQYITKTMVFYQDEVISFIHPTMQEYLAALYVFLTFTNQGKNIFEQQPKDRVRGMFKAHKVMELYKSAVDRSLPYQDGKLDIFLRFLFGMALKTNLELLQPFCTSSVKWPTFIEDAAALIRKRMRENVYPGRNSNLQCCLDELGA